MAKRLVRQGLLLLMFAVLLSGNQTQAQEQAVLEDRETNRVDLEASLPEDGDERASDFDNSIQAVSSPVDPEIEKSVVKINVTSRPPDFFRPWTKSSPTKSSGSGVVIAGPRILTNAHVVMHASEVFVQLSDGGDQLTAKVVAIAPGMDLAVVEVLDPKGLEGIKPVPWAVATRGRALRV